MEQGALARREQAEARAKELLLVATGENGDIAAVSTAARVQVTQLGRPCFFYRTFVGKQYRVSGLKSNSQLGWSLLTKSYDVLRQFKEEASSDDAGLYIEVENPGLKRLNDFVWSESMLENRRQISKEILEHGGARSLNAVYLGVTDKGNHARIWYFPNTRIAQ